MPDVVRKHASSFFYLNEEYDKSVGNEAFLLVQEWIK